MNTDIYGIAPAYLATEVTLPDGGNLTQINGSFQYSPSITPVPEPESYAMLLAGLGLMGAIARRRSRKAA